MIAIMYTITYIYKYICRDGCNLKTLVVAIKALHHPQWASREENLQKIGISSVVAVVLTFGVLVVNPRKLPYTMMANPALGLLDRENITKRGSLAAPSPRPPPPPTLLVRRKQNK